MTTNVHTELQLRERTRFAFSGGLFAGVAVGIGAFAAAGWLDARYPALGTVAPPQIVRQDATMTVAKIHTRVGHRAATCTLTIDHKHRSWSMAC